MYFLRLEKSDKHDILIKCKEGDFVADKIIFNQTIRNNFDKFPRKVNGLFAHVMNKPFVIQDLIDYHIDQDVTWDFVVMVVRVAKTLRKV